MPAVPKEKPSVRFHRSRSACRGWRPIGRARRRARQEGRDGSGPPLIARKGSKRFFRRNCHENSRAHMGEVGDPTLHCIFIHNGALLRWLGAMKIAAARAATIFTDNGAPQALVACQAADAGAVRHPRTSSRSTHCLRRWASKTLAGRDAPTRPSSGIFLFGLPVTH